MGYKQNINRLIEVEYESEDKKYVKSELLNKFEEFINASGYAITKWIKSDAVPYEVLIMDKSGRTYRIVVYLKNITHAGWKEKPWIKRVQVDNVRTVSPECYIDTENTQTFMILGYYNYDNNPLMVGWNAYKYVMHSTQRSCYITIDEMIEGYKKGYHTCVVSKQNVWVFTSDNFNIFLKNYIIANKIEE